MPDLPKKQLHQKTPGEGRMINISGTAKESEELSVWLSDLEEWSRRIGENEEHEDDETDPDEFMGKPQRIV